MKNKSKEAKKQEKKELRQYERKGIRLSLDGKYYTADQIAQVTAGMVAEEGCYMRDYISDENGRLREIEFRYIGPDRDEKNRA